MFFLRKKFCAVDLGEYSLKTAVITKKRNGKLSCTVSSYPSPGLEMLEQGEINTFSKELRECAEKAGICGEKVVSAVNSDKVIIRHLKLPRMPKKDLEKAVYWEAEKLLPISVDDLEIRHVILNESLDESEENNILKYNVLLVAVPKDTAILYYEAFESANLKLVALDLPAMALWRVFVNYSNIKDKGNKIIIDMGFKSCHFVVLNDTVISFVRTLPVGAVQILNSIIDRGYSSKEARNYLYNIYHSESEQPFLDAAASKEKYEARELILYSDGMGEIISEIKRSLDFYRLQNKVNEQIEIMVITGGLSRIEGIAALFEQELGLRVELGYPVTADDIPAQYSVAVGLALREVVII
ncbi:pilus assembly protein PilM [Peptococcaceae bacterium]|nr:pilus assembly protein PilM [Peptococcaceae bacterium]